MKSTKPTPVIDYDPTLAHSLVTTVSDKWCLQQYILKIKQNVS